MIYLNPQWQGSAKTDELKVGAMTLKSLFPNEEIIQIPLSSLELSTINNINCYKPILEQTTNFRKIIENHHPLKTSTLGGDCGVDIMPPSWLNKLYQGDFCIIWIDAHGDINTPESSPSKNFHGMPLRTLTGEGDKFFTDLLFSKLNTNQIFLMGMRNLDPPEIRFINQHNIPVYPKCSYAAIAKELHKFGNIYIHLDLDVLDIEEFPHTRLPSKNGFLIKDVLDFIRETKKNHHVVGMCITESIATNPEQLSPIQKILEEVIL